MLNLVILVYNLILKLGSLVLCGGHVGSSTSPGCCCFASVNVSGSLRGLCFALPFKGNETKCPLLLC